MKPRPAQLAIVIASAALISGAGCGSDEEQEGSPLPRQTATDLERRLDEVQRRFDAATEEGKAGACKDIDEDSYPAIDGIVNGLPEDVDRDVRNALQASLERLRELTREGCSNVEDTRTPEEPPAPVTPPPEPAEPQTTPERTETEKQPEEKKKKKEEEENEEKDGGGGGSGGQEPPGQGGGGVPAPAPQGD